jgi:hypothetical protein
MYKGKCAECNAHWNSKAFKSRPAGYDLPIVDERRVGFAFESASNTKLCGSCNQKNFRLLKRERDGNKDRREDGAKMARLDENNGAENVHTIIDKIGMMEEDGRGTSKEGTAISVLLHLSML